MCEKWLLAPHVPIGTGKPDDRCLVKPVDKTQKQTGSLASNLESNSFLHKRISPSPARLLSATLCNSCTAAAFACDLGSDQRSLFDLFQFPKVLSLQCFRSHTTVPVYQSNALQLLLSCDIVMPGYVTVMFEHDRDYLGALGLAFRQHKSLAW